MLYQMSKNREICSWSYLKSLWAVFKCPWEKREKINSYITKPRTHKVVWYLLLIVFHNIILMSLVIQSSIFFLSQPVQRCFIVKLLDQFNFWIPKEFYSHTESLLMVINWHWFHFAPEKQKTNSNLWCKTKY